MKSFYVALSDESDLKLASSSATALLNYFLLALFGESFFFNKCRFCFFCQTASPRGAIEWSTEKIYSECLP